jgi:hypothetical protein
VSEEFFGTLIDADATGYEAAVDLFQFRDAGANESLRPFLAFDIVERDLQGHLHEFLPLIEQGSEDQRVTTPVGSGSAMGL